MRESSDSSGNDVGFFYQWFTYAQTTRNWDHFFSWKGCSLVNFKIVNRYPRNMALIIVHFSNGLTCLVYIISKESASSTFSWQRFLHFLVCASLFFERRTNWPLDIFHMELSTQISSHARKAEVRSMVAALNQALYEEFGLQGNQADYYNPDTQLGGDAVVKPRKIGIFRSMFHDFSALISGGNHIFWTEAIMMHVLSQDLTLQLWLRKTWAWHGAQNHKTVSARHIWGKLHAALSAVE